MRGSSASRRSWWWSCGSGSTSPAVSAFPPARLLCPFGPDSSGRPQEGIFAVPAGVFAPAPVLLAAHQAKPRRIGVFDAETLQQQSLWRLPGAARKKLGDLNDIALTGDGQMLVLSGKSGLIARLLVDSGKLRLQGIYRIKAARGDVPEGITVDAKDRIWVCTDGRGMLHRIDLVQSPARPEP